MGTAARTAIFNLDTIISRAAVAGPVVANAMAAHGQKKDRDILTRLSHPAETKTPSPTGFPPASISGQLAASIATGDATPAAGGLRWVATAGPTRAASSDRGPYGRFLEFGGVHRAHTLGGMRWFEDGRWHTAYVLRKFQRPYLADAMDEMENDGSLHAAATAAFLEVTSG